MMAFSLSRATGVSCSMGTRHLAGASTFLRRAGARGDVAFAPPRATVTNAGAMPKYSWYYSIKNEQPEPLETSIKGEVPAWISGSFLRNGPGKFKVGNDSYNHLFDGLSLLTRFNIHNGKVTYQSRFQHSDSYTKAMAQNRIVMSEFGTMAHPDPCLSLFGRFMSWFKPPEFSDNCNVNWMNIGDECYVMTETKNIRKIDPDSLETLDKVDISKRVSIHMATAHPHSTNDGTLYNMGSHFAKQTHYNIIKIPPPDLGVKADPMSKASVLCSIPASQKHPSYYHSFGMTDNYIVFLEQPLVLDMVKLLFGRIFKTAFADVTKFQEKRPARFHLIKRDTGELLSQMFLADAFFCFHHINAYEEAGHVVVDLCCYRDDSIIKGFKESEMRKGNPPVDAEVRRYVLPVEREKTPGVNLNGLEPSKTTAVLMDNGSIYCTPEVIADSALELPRINYEKHNGKPYKYLYGIGGGMEKLMKVDTRTATSQAWSEEGYFPSEPVFIGAPGSTSEDDGVVVSSVIGVQEDKPPLLLVLDARDMKEVARAEIPAEVSYGIHGMYLAN